MSVDFFLHFEENSIVFYIEKLHTQEVASQPDF